MARFGRIIPVTAISLNKTSVSLTVGNTVTLMASILPTNATNKSVTWRSSNPSVATVNSQGVVKGMAIGSAKITAISSNGRAASCTVTVTAAIQDTPPPVIDPVTSGISLISPPAGLTSAKGDGSNESAVIQAIIDYVVKNKTTLIIPENYTFFANGLVIDNASGFTITGAGILKNIAAAKKALLTISNSYDFNIPLLNTDGNVANNTSSEGMVNQYIISLKLINCRDFKLGTINDKNPAGDSVYLNDVTDMVADTIYGKADVPSGRNCLSIIKAQGATIGKVISDNIGALGMPGGIDLEPNLPTDTIQGVVIKDANVRITYGDGIAITNQFGALVKDNEINGIVTKTAASQANGCSLKLNKAQGVKGNIKVLNESKTPCSGAYITGCSGIDMNLDIENANYGIELGEKSSDINLTGKIIGTKRDGLAIYNGLAQSAVNMEIKKVGQGGVGRAVAISEWGVTDDIMFSGDYSYDSSGTACFRIDHVDGEGAQTNLRTVNLKTDGWPVNKIVTGAGAKALQIA